jgi:hypothetical protein
MPATVWFAITSLGEGRIRCRPYVKLPIADGQSFWQCVRLGPSVVPDRDRTPYFGPSKSRDHPTFATKRFQAN